MRRFVGERGIERYCVAGAAVVCRRRLSSRPPGTGQLQLRFVAEQKKRMRRANEKKAQRVAGGAIALCGAGVLSYGHADLVLSCLRDPNFVGSMLMVAGVATSLAPSVREVATRASGLREDIRGLRVQMASTQASVEDLLRQVKDEDESAKNGSPSKVLHLRSVPKDATLEELDGLFSKTSPPTRILPLMHKNQALVQFDTVYDATTALGILDTEGMRIRKRKILAAYSVWPALKSPSVPRSQEEEGEVVERTLESSSSRDDGAREQGTAAAAGSVEERRRAQ